MQNYPLDAFAIFFWHPCEKGKIEERKRRNTPAEILLSFFKCRQKETVKLQAKMVCHNFDVICFQRDPILQFWMKQLKRPLNCKKKNGCYTGNICLCKITWNKLATFHNLLNSICSWSHLRQTHLCKTKNEKSPKLQGTESKDKKRQVGCTALNNWYSWERRVILMDTFLASKNWNL